MSVMSLKEYARVSNVSYEAVRQQVKRYASELEGHVHREGRQQFLDDEAVAFLDSKRQKNPVVIYQASKDEELEDLRAENQQLWKDLAAAKELLLQNGNAVALLESAKEQQTELKGRVGQLENDLKEARQEAKEAERERRESEDRAWKRERELETKAEDLQKQLDNERALAEAKAAELQAQLVAEKQRNRDLQSMSLFDRMFRWRKK